MLETFTPAVCGSRKRQIVAQALFATTAIATAAALGLALGAVGSALGARQAVLAAAALALVAAAREAGIVRFPLPQARRQVPERWRFELPLPVWATGYGAGLGAGFFTYQPVSTFWVACAAALALGRPLPAALCLSLYGVGRAAMVVWPRRRGDDPTAAVERLAGRRGALLRANVAALVACGVLLALAPAAGGAVMVQSARSRPVGRRRHHRVRVAGRRRRPHPARGRRRGPRRDRRRARALALREPRRGRRRRRRHGLGLAGRHAGRQHPRRLPPGPRLAAARLRQDRFRARA